MGRGLTAAQPSDAAQHGMTAQLERDVALPLAGVQQSLVSQLAFWDHSGVLSAAVMGLYTVPKVRRPIQQGKSQALG